MAFENGMNNVEISAAFIESLQNDFKNLSLESKKKYPVIKEVTWIIIITFLLL